MKVINRIKLWLEGYDICPNCQKTSLKEKYCDFYKCESCGYWQDMLWGHSGRDESY